MGIYKSIPEICETIYGRITGGSHGIGLAERRVFFMVFFLVLCECLSPPLLLKVLGNPEIIIIVS
jgi:hypothetical protein